MLLILLDRLTADEPAFMNNSSNKKSVSKEFPDFIRTNIEIGGRLVYTHIEEIDSKDRNHINRNVTPTILIHLVPTFTDW